MRAADGREAAGLAAGTGGGAFGLQALVEYGALNSLLRDGSMALQRLGGWAADNWLITGMVLGAVIFVALRPRR